MFPNAKKILITTESHEIFVIRQEREQAVTGFCTECGEEVEMMDFDTAVILSGIGGREFMRRSAEGGVHSIEAATGQLLICRRSLTSGMLND